MSGEPHVVSLRSSGATSPVQLAGPQKILCAALGVVYLWFGALKLLGMSPVLELIRGAYPPLASGPFYVALAVFEVALGAALIAGAWPRQAAVAVVLHVAGTFGVLFLAPRAVFQPWFLFLTLEGEFIVKNVVLLAAGVALWSMSPPESMYRTSRQPPDRRVRCRRTREWRRRCLHPSHAAECGDRGCS